MIIAVYSDDVKYTSESPANKLHVVGSTIIYSCEFKQTTYGSVIITRPTHDKIIELYPGSIDYIIHSK
jgi:hypothetical protein